jgi:hypothetical protein
MSISRTIGAFFCGGLLMSRPAQAQEDPGAPGPRPTTVGEYGSFSTNIPGGLGQIAVVEELAQVHYPTSLGTETFPLVIFLHGAHESCYNVTAPETDLEPHWPCDPATELPVPSYKGFDYVASTLASHGMIVVSISANGINAAGNAFGSAERPLLIQHHLSKWQTFATTGGAPFGSKFVGRVDLGRIAVGGHSRGGQAALAFATETQPAGLRAVLAIEPTGSGGQVPLNNVPLALLLGYCDGDQFQLRNLGNFDQARYGVANDAAPKYTVLALGANHNYFNRIWSPGEFVAFAYDEWGVDGDPYCDPNPLTRLTPAEQRQLGTAYIAAFLRKHLLGASQFDPILNGDALPPPSVATDEVYIGYLPPSNDRKDLNRLITSTEAQTNTLQGAVASTGVSANFCDGSACTQGTSRVGHFGSLTAMKLRWTSLGGSFSNALPVGQRDTSGFATLQFRVGVNHTDTPASVVGQSQDFSIRLVDGGGHTSLVHVGDYSDGLYYPPGLDENKAVVLNTVRVPMNAFLGIDTTQTASVDLVFDRKSAGSILVTDFAFSDKGLRVVEKWLVSTGP